MIKGKNIKRILAVLMMALMMVSFMPTMSVFADEAGTDAEAAETTDAAANDAEAVESTEVDAANDNATNDAETADDAAADDAEADNAEVTETAEPTTEAPATEAPAADPKDISVLITISNGGEIVEAKDGSPVAFKEVKLTGKSEYTLDDVFKAAHEAYNKDGESAYSTYESQWGLGVGKFWGVENGGNYGYQMNSGAVMVMGPGQVVSDGDIVDAYVLVNPYPDTEAYAVFDKLFVETDASEFVVLTLKEAQYDENYNMVFVPVEGASVSVLGDSESTEAYTTDKDGQVVILLTTAGDYLVVASKTKELNGEIVPAITAAVANIAVVANSIEPPTKPADSATTPAATTTTTTKPAATTSTTSVPKTGDAENAFAFVILFAAAVTVLVVVRKTARR